MNTSKQVVSVSFTNFHDDPVTVTLMIYSRDKGNRFDMDILVSGQKEERLPIAMTSKDLEELNRWLRARMNKVIRNFINRESISPEDAQADFVKLANIGRHAFTEVFSATRAQRAMLDVLSFSDQIIFEINSEDFSMPWELLYPEPLGKDPSYEKFWGMKHIISRVINKEGRRFISPRIRIESLPVLGLLAYSNLPGVAQHEIPFFEQLKMAGKIKLFKMPPLDPEPEKRDGELDKFKKFWNRKFHIAHFACHACGREEPHFDSFIQLSNGIRITLLELKEAEIIIKEHPLVILNACETGRLSSMNTRDFAGDFIRYGARGVVATEHAVPDVLASEFTKELYSHLLEGKKLGESILETRRELLRRGNPLGLLYSIYAPPATKLDYVK